MKSTKLFYKKDFIKSCKKRGKLIKFVRTYSWEANTLLMLFLNVTYESN